MNTIRVDASLKLDLYDEDFSVMVTFKETDVTKLGEDNIKMDLMSVQFSDDIHTEYLCTPADYNDLEDGLIYAITDYFETNPSSYNNPSITDIRVDL